MSTTRSAAVEKAETLGRQERAHESSLRPRHCVRQSRRFAEQLKAEGPGAQKQTPEHKVGAPKDAATCESVQPLPSWRREGTAREGGRPQKLHAPVRGRQGQREATKANGNGYATTGTLTQAPQQ